MSARELQLEKGKGEGNSLQGHWGVGEILSQELGCCVNQSKEGDKVQLFAQGTIANTDMSLCILVLLTLCSCPELSK